MYAQIYNLHDVMLFMTAGLAILLAVPMLVKRRRQLTDILLAAFILTQGLAALYYVFLYSEALQQHTVTALAPFHIFPIVVLYALQGPLLSWYSRAMAGLAVRPGRGDAVMAVVLVILPLLVVAVLWITDRLHPGFEGNIFTFFTLIASVVYGVMALKTVRRHEHTIRERYSNIDDINLVWLSYAAFGFAGVWAFRLVGYLLMVTGNEFWIDFFAAGANVPAIILIAWMVILGQSAPGPGKPTRGNGSGSSKPDPEVIRRLEDLMERVKVYQDPDLDREGLADSLGLSPRTLSALINGHYGQNFYDFVNRYRVLETKTRLEDPGNSDVTVQRIFEDAGFNSKSTFNTLFKRATGKTPTEFRREAR